MTMPARFGSGEPREDYIKALALLKKVVYDLTA
jgi:hypothetical protein